MAIFTKEQISELIKERNMKTTEDISSMFKDLFGETLQEMLDAELDTTLGYAKNENASKTNSNRRNGHSKKIVVSEHGDSEIAVPQDWDGEHAFRTVAETSSIPIRCVQSRQQK
jgi:putative transposase